MGRIEAGLDRVEKMKPKSLNLDLGLYGQGDVFAEKHSIGARGTLSYAASKNISVFAEGGVDYGVGFGLSPRLGYSGMVGIRGRF